MINHTWEIRIIDNAQLMAIVPEMLVFIEKLTDIPILELEDSGSEVILDWVEKEARSLSDKVKSCYYS